MNSIGKLIQSSTKVYSNGSNLVNFSKNTIDSSKFLSTLNLSSKNERFASLYAIHKSCFNTLSAEQRFLEEVGDNSGNPALNPSPS
ncbi:hypothetical protein DDB_G0278013 [Dictyostelium discoideum AX4]|uniref:Uncharacterized protein n=1 Tax=Dictyostelium discoideum TaxID=44689 RepID=Q54YY2_DICDI|nr:hypothetical protein DDB_G0278013 [Dictyostelium discoideum AX4]EAL68179.1 hypothetical protein DDB_G0278013 [Dictyostelium discoideum AX4]|eukprot:XP_642070.1 hypothetical protein DDB_G0278013 [Dictyostelium discoideum AX4]